MDLEGSEVNEKIRTWKVKGIIDGALNLD